MTAVANRKVVSRQRTKMRLRKKISGTEERPRVSVFRSSKHIYTQVISDITGKTLVSASTLDKEVVDALKKAAQPENGSKSTKSVTAAKVVGMVLASRCKAQKIESVVFDRNGYRYTGRIQGIADGAREGGLAF